MSNSSLRWSFGRRVRGAVGALGVMLAIAGAARAQAPSLSLSASVAGCPTTLALQADPGSFFWIGLDIGPGPVAVPGLGTVALDLGPSFVLLVDSLALGLTTDAAGLWSSTFALPPTLAGTTIYVQALVVGPGGIALSNPLGANFSAAAPLSWSVATGAVPAETWRGEDVRFADLDGDGDLDVAVANSGNALPGSAGLQVLVNQGGLQGGAIGSYADDVINALNGFIYPSLCVVPGDVDGDGDIDLFLGIDDGGTPSGAVNSNNLLLINQGGGQSGVEGRFAPDPNFPGGGYETQSAEFVDVDNDGDLDLICGNGVDRVALPQPCELFENLGAGVFSLSAAHFANASWNQPGETDAVVSGDVDGDGSTDLVLVRDGTDLLLVNNGVGVFSGANPALFPAPFDNSTGGAMGDLDQDGDLDVYVTNIGQPDRVFWNQGNLSFSVTTIAATGAVNLHMGCALSDLDQDGDLDVVVSTHPVGGPQDVPFVQINQGGAQGGAVGTYSTSLLTSAPAEIFLAVAVADVDQDGDDDAFFASQGFFGMTAQDFILVNGVCF